MNDAVAKVVGTTLYTFMYNGVRIDLARRIVVFVKHRTLLNVRVNVSAPSMLSPSINERLTRGDLERLLQTYANVVAICLERLKTRFCVF